MRMSLLSYVDDLMCSCAFLQPAQELRESKLAELRSRDAAASDAHAADDARTTI